MLLLRTKTISARTPVLVLRLLGICIALLFISACQQDGDIELIVYNANILSMDTSSNAPSMPGAFAVSNGKFVAVGSTADIKALAQNNTQLVDAQGKTLIPGFNDSHLHSIMLPPTAIDAGRIDKIDDLVASLSALANTTEQGKWIVAYGYDDTLFGRHLNRHDLDRVSQDKPVLAMHGSGHIFATNSHALQVANITADTPDPDKGKFYRDELGAATGLMLERPAINMLFNEQQPNLLPSSLGDAVSQLREFFKLAHSHGITSYGEAMVPPELSIAYWWADPEAYGIRVNMMFDGEDLPGTKRIDSINQLLSKIGLGFFGDQWLRGETVKLFHGHSLSGRTARLFKPYADRPDYYGEEPQRNQTELNQLISEVHEMGFQAAVHVNGDYEVDMVLQAIEQANVKAPREHRHRLEHASIVTPELLNEAKKQAVVIAPHSYIYEKGPMIEAYGEARWPWMFANKSIVDLGIVNAANSDFPIAALPPMLRIQSLVTRTSRFGKTYGESQRLSVEEALYAYTMGGAMASFEEQIKGSISVGKFADFVILSSDPRHVAPLELHQVRVEATYVDGIKRYSEK